jgi:hypothetical protein
MARTSADYDLRIAKRTIGAQIDKQMLAPLDVFVPHVTKRMGKTGGRDVRLCLTELIK